MLWALEVWGPAAGFACYVVVGVSWVVLCDARKPDGSADIGCFMAALLWPVIVVGIGAVLGMVFGIEALHRAVRIGEDDDDG